MEQHTANSSRHPIGEDSAILLSGALLFVVVLASALMGWPIFALPLVCIVPALLGRIDPYGFVMLTILPVTLTRAATASLSVIPQDALRVATLLLLMAALLFLPRSSRPGQLSAVIVAWGLMFAFAAGLAPYVSMYPSVSFAKAVFAGLFILMLVLSSDKETKFPVVIAGAACAISIGSLLCYFIYPSIGYSYREILISENKYSGLTAHPQLFGCVLGMSAPLLAHLYFSRHGIPRLIYAVAFMAVPVDLYLSASRTGMIAFVLSTAFYAGFVMWRSRSSAMVRSANVVAVTALLLGVLTAAVAWEKVTAFVAKGDPGGEINVSYRDEIVRMSWEGFLASPYVGNGFQVPSVYSDRVKTRISFEEGTSVEKCFAGTMILEEMGIVGALLFLAGAVCLLSVYLERRAYLCVASLVGFAAVNLGEAVVFSPSSLGGMCWLMVVSTSGLEME